MRIVWEEGPDSDEEREKAKKAKAKARALKAKLKAKVLMLDKCLTTSGASLSLTDPPLLNLCIKPLQTHSISF